MAVMTPPRAHDNGAHDHGAHDHGDGAEDFLAAPRHRLFAVFAERWAAEEGVEALRFEGFGEDEDIWLLSGDEGIARLDATGEGHGRLARLLRRFQAAMSPQPDYWVRLDDALRGGASVVSVLVDREGDVEAVARMLRLHGATFVARFGDWVFTPVAA
ncbi:MAG TPA: hypothetical protein VEI83_00150 [Acidimicrobiales bacterium]|nr:hypothetical protein [Acidimicrobiales bacterium]